MGFLSRLVNGAVQAKDDAALEISKLGRADDINALLAVMALVAGCDGSVSKEEETAMLEYITLGDVFKGFDKKNLEDRMSRNLKKCTSMILREDLEKDIMGIADEPDTCISVIKAAIAVAASEDGIGDDEKETIMDVCSMLSVDPKKFRQLR